MFRLYREPAKRPFSQYHADREDSGVFPRARPDGDWKKKLKPDQYHVLRESGTERAFTSPYNNETREGIYHCAACDWALFSSVDKFNSGTGWPSFSRPIHIDSVRIDIDYKLGTVREEVLCAGCGGHLGHVFQDGPAPTGRRYCMNGVAMNFNRTPQIPS